jgi:hypothetical protein
VGRWAPSLPPSIRLACPLPFASKTASAEPYRPQPPPALLWAAGGWACPRAWWLPVMLVPVMLATSHPRRAMELGRGAWAVEARHGGGLWAKG